jgi:pantothenate synthetase
MRWREEINMSDEDNKSLRIYEAVSYESALDASDRNAGLTLAERDEARQIVGNMREMVRAKQRAERAVTRAKRVRPSIFAMARDAMEVRFNALLAAHPDAVIACRDLTVLTDDDLRTALEDAEVLVERLERLS